jgi:hypothetical protein
MPQKLGKLPVAFASFGLLANNAAISQTNKQTNSSHKQMVTLLHPSIAQL